MGSKINSKRGAIEMSMTTIVTIVLVVVTLVLALVLIRTIFTSSTNAIEQVDTAIQDQVNKLFASEGTSFIVYPASRAISITRGDVPKGFAFSIENPSKETVAFSYNVSASDVSSCGTSFTKDRANSYLLGGTGDFSLGAGAKLALSRLVKFDVPDTALKCTIVYTLDVSGTGASGNADGFPTSADVYVTIQ